MIIMIRKDLGLIKKRKGDMDDSDIKEFIQKQSKITKVKCVGAWIVLLITIAL